jgi:pimeloyl-ACP methyl ester carboxylesterase
MFDYGKKNMQNSLPPTRFIQVEDGRTLAFSEYGAPQGRPVFFFHGWPGARLQGQLADEPAKKLNVRFISPDRPGFGLSDFQPGRSILDWPKDINDLAEHLGLQQFAVLGLSGGAPYALACAHEIPQKLTAVGIISGSGPIDAPGAAEGVSLSLKRTIRLTQRAPWLVKFILWRSSRRVRQDPDGSFQKLIASLPEADRSALIQPGVKKRALEARIDSFQSGSCGHLLEIGLFAIPWGFRLEDILIPIHLWHGKEDQEILPVTAQMQAEAIQNCRATFLPLEGHYSLYINHIEGILKELIAEN